jgi:N-acetylglucosamine kinase
MILGVDVGGTKIELTGFDESFSPLHSIRVDTPTEDYAEFLDAIEVIVASEVNGSSEPYALGIGLPCTFDEVGHALSANIPAITGRAVRYDLRKRLGDGVVFENDVNAFAFSEAHGGAGQGSRIVLGVVLGTGVGGGICIDGSLYQTRQGLACEYGHLPIPGTLKTRHRLPDRKCGCGAFDCYNIYVSGPGLEWLGEFCGLSAYGPRQLLEATKLGDKRAQIAFDIYLDLLGSLMSQLTLIYDPDIIVLGGGMSKVPELYGLLPKAIEPHLIAGSSAPTVVAPVFGDSSGTRGMALLGYRAFCEARDA